MRSTWNSTAFWRILGCATLVLIGMGWLYHKTSPSAYKDDKILDVEEPIYNTTLGFQKILVLNMPSRTDHADWIRLTTAVSDLQVEFIAGVNGDDVPDKVLPYPPHRDLGSGNIGSWRAHLNAMAYIVANNITSALILEDDVDWDTRIKQQMREFARGTRSLLQPKKGTVDEYADTTLRKTRPKEPQPRHELGDDDQHFDISRLNAPSVKAPTNSPYGDGWDVLWPGHCSMRFPRAEDHIPKGRYLILDDETMLPRAKVSSADIKVMPGDYPASTRIVHHVWDPVCTYAYAVSQAGARKILWDFGIKRFDRAFDNLLAEFCDMNVCMAVTPQLFSAFAAPGPINRDSEINGFDQDKSTEVRDKGWSENIQRSVRLNMQSILDGVESDELEDQFPDNT